MSLVDKLKNRLAEIAETTISNLHRVPNHVSEERMNICNSCEHLFIPTSQCKKCGCFVKLKTTLQSSSCPIKKWNIYEVPNENH